MRRQGALVANQNVIYALRRGAPNRLNTMFIGGLFVAGAAGSSGTSLAWKIAWLGRGLRFRVTLVAVDLCLNACGLAAENRHSLDVW